MVLLTLKYVHEGDKLTDKITLEALRLFESIGSQAKTFEQAKKCPKIADFI